MEEREQGERRREWEQQVREKEEEDMRVKRQQENVERRDKLAVLTTKLKYILHCFLFVVFFLSPLASSCLLFSFLF